MSKECTLHILDQVNVKFEGLDVVTRRKLSNEVKYFLPYARHVPSFKLGRWDGMVRYCDIGGRTYLNVLDRLLPIVQDAGYAINLEDHREPFSPEFESASIESLSHIQWPEGHQIAGENIMLRDHQVEVINYYLNNPQSIQKVSTGAGKTIITAVLSKRVEKYGRSIIIVPSKDLVTQTERDYKNIGLDVGVYYGDRKEPDHMHTICTWQSIEALDKKSKTSFDDDMERTFTKDVVCVIVDECHSAKSDVLKKHLTSTFKNVPLRWGMTGTVPKEDYSSLGIICSVGPLINEVAAKDLQEKGILSNLNIDILQIQDFCTTFSDYQSELKYLTTDKNRMEFISNIIQEKADGNTLILVSKIATGEMLSELIPDSVFISGTVKSTKRKEEYTSIQEDNDKCIIATYGVASVGIDIPRLFNVVMIEPGKSFVRVIQSIGRGLRMAKDKDFVNIYDITSTAKYSKKHLTERKKFYKDEQYPFKIEKIKLE